MKIKQFSLLAFGFYRLLIVDSRIRLFIICIIFHIIFSLIQKLLINALLIILQNTFHYDSGYWSNRGEYNLPGGETGFDSQETKLPTYWNTSFSKICLGMKIDQQINFITINTAENSSLYSLIVDGNYRNTSLGRDTWKTLIGSEASLQTNCNKEGFNVVSSSSHSKARIGLLGNENNNCGSCDSRIGFGTGGKPDDSNTCGNEAEWQPDNGEKHITAMGYILVQ